MRIPGGIRAVALALLLCALTASPAAAHHDRTSVPSGLTQTLGSTGGRFLAHYDPSTTTDQYVRDGLADFEEAYSRLVAGAGGTPNAGLEVPHDDGDGKIDVYFGRPTSFSSDFSGGVVFDDSAGHSPRGSYVFMTADLGRQGFRFRAAHELMHVIQGKYVTGSGLLTESTANWAAEFALPDVDPLDSNFAVPHLPLDCSYGTWDGASCGNGYRQWLFLQHLTEDYGADVIHGLLDRMRTVCPGGCSRDDDRALLYDEINAQDGSATLASRYAAYARDSLDPSRWATTAPRSIRDRLGPHEATTISQFQDASGTAVVDHLGTRYLRISNVGGYETSGPSTTVSVQVNRPLGVSSSTFFMRTNQGGPFSDAAPPLGGTGGTVQLPADPKTATEFWVPLTNDDESASADNLQFSWQVTWNRGTPTPPSNDDKAGATTLGLDQQIQQSNAYAGGAGHSEAFGCPATVSASRGTWYRFTAPNNGTYYFDSRTSDFHDALAVYNDVGLLSCGGDLGGFVSLNLTRGESVLVYVGRHRNASLAHGHTVGLTAYGPGAPPPRTQVTTSTPPPQQGSRPDPETDTRLEPGTRTSTACTKARRAYTSASKAYSKAKKAAKKAKGKAAKKRANAKLKKAKKKLAAAKRARTKACST